VHLASAFNEWFLRGGRPQESKALLRAMEELISDHESLPLDDKARALILRIAGRIRQHGLEWDEAKKWALESTIICRAQHEPSSLRNALDLMADIHFDVGDYKSAKDNRTEALQISHVLSGPPGHDKEAKFAKHLDHKKLG